MPHIALTQLGAERLRPAATEVIYWDRNFPGFGLRVSPKGKKTFLVQYRVRRADGSLKERQETLGTLAFLTVAEARERARQSRAKASAGVDPVAEKRVAKEAAEVARKTAEFTLAKLVEQYEAEYVNRYNKRSGAAVKMGLLLRWINKLGDRPANSITEEDVLKFKNDLLRGRSNGRATADHLVGALGHMYRWAKQRRLVASNPAADIAREWKYVPRERYLTRDEIKLFWSACDQAGWPVGPIFKLLLLTGQRENEIGGMTWDELDFEKRTLNLPGARTKNGRAHTVHLSNLAFEIIETLPRINGSRYVFTTNGKVPFTNYAHAKGRLHRLMGDVPEWRPHDLRRTATTVMAEIGVPHHVADKVLNHTAGKISGVAAVYNRFEYLDERKTALNALGRHIEQLIGRGDDTVVPLRRA